MNETRLYQMTGKDKIISFYMLIGVVVQLLILFFYGNWANLDILLYLGMISLILSAVLFLSSNILKTEGGMEKAKGFVTTKLVDKGIYGIIRHPIYLSLAYVFIGFALISQHPLSLFFGATLGLCCYYFMIKEEKLTLEKFGEEYKQYMERIPR
ncbi:MAG: isoprenylcysteine carboxylmethyltransferase family protein [Candidatus Heimdallarchaeota archaeon]|nr:MAG: isoprenylcysteine carboxylmethyltransferase family protein [Candidatus Heimdallarchaeota archaeon]